MKPTAWFMTVPVALTLSAGFALGAFGAEQPSKGQVLLKRALSLDVGADGAPNAVQALAAMRQAAQAGNSEAAFNVAVMLDSGRGSARDITEAAIWYARAADRGERRGAFNLGMLYEGGEGVPANADLARAWYIASDLPAARKRLSGLNDTHRPVQVQVPRLLFPKNNSVVEVDDKFIELVWTSPLQPEPVQYFVEVRRDDAGLSNELWSGFVDVSSVRLSLPPSIKTLAWRATAVAKGVASRKVSDWSVFSIVTAEMLSSNDASLPQVSEATNASRAEDHEKGLTAKSHVSSEPRPEAVTSPPQAILEKVQPDHVASALPSVPLTPLQTHVPQLDVAGRSSEKSIAPIAPLTRETIPENSVSHSPPSVDNSSTAALHIARSVLIILAQPSITRFADLNDKAVIIAGLKTISQAGVEAAMNSAGAGSARLEEGTKNDIDRLISGQVSAAVVALVSPAKAETFPEIPGFRLLRIDVDATGVNSAPSKN